MIRFPHLVDHYRPNTTFDATNMETAAAPTTVEKVVKCYIAKPGSDVMETAFGPVPTGEELILLQPYDSNGKLRVVRDNDFFEDRDTSLRWIAKGPGDPLPIPSSLAGHKVKFSHIEVKVVRSDLESATVYPTTMVEP